MKVPEVIAQLRTKALTDALGDQGVRELHRWIGEIYHHLQRELNGHITPGENWGWYFAAAYDPTFTGGVAGDLQVFPHGLGYTPSIFIPHCSSPIGTTPFSVYWNSVEQAGWTATQFSFRATRASVGVEGWLA